MRGLNKNRFDVLFMVGVAIAFLAIGVYVAFFAPCDALGWFPVKDLPARCLKGFAP